jgi:hypothetical protein
MSICHIAPAEYLSHCPYQRLLVLALPLEMQ